jgi:hypothetical protein
METSRTTRLEDLLADFAERYATLPGAMATPCRRSCVRPSVNETHMCIGSDLAAKDVAEGTD